MVPEKLTVTITEDGRILFDDGQVAPEDVAHTMAPLPKEAPIVFNVDKGAQFGLFVQVLDAAKGQDRANFVINTAPRDKEKP